MVEFTSEPHWDWCFLFWMVVKYWFNFFKRHRHINIIYFLSCKFNSLLSPRNWYILSRLSTVRAVFHSTLFFILNVYRIHIHNPCFISDISNLYLPSFHNWIISFVGISKESDILLLIFFYWFPVFSFIGFLVLIYFLLLTWI